MPLLEALAANPGRTQRRALCVSCLHKQQHQHNEHTGLDQEFSASYLEEGQTLCCPGSSHKQRQGQKLSHIL